MKKDIPKWRYISNRMMRHFALQHFDRDGMCKLSQEELEARPHLYRSMIWRGHARFSHWLGERRFMLLGHMLDLRTALAWKQEFNLDMLTDIPRRNYAQIP